MVDCRCDSLWLLATSHGTDGRDSAATPCISLRDTTNQRKHQPADRGDARVGLASRSRCKCAPTADATPRDVNPLGAGTTGATCLPARTRMAGPAVALQPELRSDSEVQRQATRSVDAVPLSDAGYESDHVRPDPFGRAVGVRSDCVRTRSHKRLKFVTACAGHGRIYSVSGQFVPRSRGTADCLATG